MTSSGESRETALGADAKTVLKQRALATLHRVRQAHDGEWLLATSFAIQPLVRRQELLQRHAVAEPTTNLRIDLVSNVRMPPPRGHNAKRLPAKYCEKQWNTIIRKLAVLIR